MSEDTFDPGWGLSNFSISFRKKAALIGQV